MSISVLNGNISSQAASNTGGFQVSAEKKPADSYASRVAKMSKRAGYGAFGRKKKLNYNPREISQQILRAAKVIGASQVLVRARGKVGVLERCRATGQYDDNETRVALAHARRMVKCARMKVNHLKEEEQQKKRDASAEEENGRQKTNEVKRKAQTKKQQLKQRAQLEMKKLELAQQRKARQEALNQKRRLHRNKEREEIEDAEMKYLKGDTGTEPEYSPAVSYAGAVFAASAQLADLQSQYMQLDDEIERAIAQEIAAADMSVDAMASGGLDSASAAAPAAEGAVDVAGDAVSIDVSI